MKLFGQINIQPGDVNIPQGVDSATALENGLTLFFTGISVVAVIVIIVAGILYMVSQGEPQKLIKARNTIIYAVIGLVIALLSRAIVPFVAGGL